MASTALTRFRKSMVVRPLGALAAGLTRIQQQLYEAPNFTITGTTPGNWPSALQPVAPFGNETTQPLGMNLQLGQNLLFTPRPDARYSAAELQMYARYPLARMCISAVQDIICALPWRIQLKKQPGESRKERETRQMKDDTLLLLTDFISQPNQDQDFASFIRPVLNDLLTIDAPSILLRYDRKNVVYEWRPLQGAYIVCLVTDQGYTPEAPSPAYQFLWEGIPIADMSTDQLVYKPRNIVYQMGNVSSGLYGMSPTETLAEEIEVGIQRLRYVTDFYKDGTVPNVVWVVPPEATPDRVEQAMKVFTSRLAGNLEARRQAIFAQGFVDKGEDHIHQFKEPELADTYDDLHIRKIAFGYGVSPQRLLKMMTRATAQMNQEASEEEGLAPIREWVAKTVNFILQRKMGYDKYEFAFDSDRDPDPLNQSKIDASDIKSGIVTINECRVRRGWDERPEPQASELGTFTPTGWVALGAQPPTASPGKTSLPKSGDDEDEPSPPPTPKKKSAPKLDKGRTTPFKYGTVQLNIPKDSEAGRAILSLAGSIPDEHLAGDGRTEEPHITVRYGLKEGSDFSDVEDYLGSHEQFDITFGLTDSFEPSEHSDGAAPIFVGVDSKVLGSIHEALADHGDFKDSDFEYHPHATIAYVDPDKASLYAGDAALAGTSFTVRSLSINPKDGDPVEVALAIPSAKVAKRQTLKKNIEQPPASIDPSRDSIRLRNATSVMHARLMQFFHHITANLVLASTPVRKSKTRKADNPDDDKRIEEIIEALMARIAWGVLPDYLEPAIQEAGLDGTAYGLDQVQRMEAAEKPAIVPETAPAEPLLPSPIVISQQPVRVVTQALISETNQVAMDYAKERSAEMVGMKWVDGELVTNPNAKWAITDSTRNMLRTILTDAFSKDTPLDQIVQRIKDAGVFSEERAKMIANTEIKMAQVRGNYAAWEKAGLVKTVRWLLSADHPQIDDCDSNAAAGEVKFGDAFPSGVLTPPDHPNCLCSLSAVSIGGLFRKW